MNKQPVFTLLLGGSIAAITSCNKQAEQEKDFRPNFLFIVTEDISPMLGSYGDTVALTPNLDELAREGMIFSNCYSVSGVCAPSRNSLITGMYPSSIGGDNMRANRKNLPDGIPPYESVPPAGVKCYTEFFRAAGYYTSNNSKEDYQFNAPVTAWDESSGYAHWRNRKPGQPFFAIFNIMTTHESQTWDRANDPVVIPPEWVTVPPYYPDVPAIREEIARVYSNITIMDREVGEILDQLREDHLEDSTIVIFYSDHGGPLPRQKRSMYDSGLKVPMIIRFPDGSRAGTSFDELVSFVDFPATWLSLAGIDVPDYMQGQAFLGGQKAPERQYIYAARDRMDGKYDMVRAVRDKRFKYIRNYQPDKPVYQDIEFRKKGLKTMQTLLKMRDAGELNETQMLWFRPTKPTEELYDCDADPFEVHNIADDPEYQDVLVRMREAHEAWMKEIDDKGQLTEKELVWSMWPGGIQPVTATPVVDKTPSGLTVTSATDGASIGYKINAVDLRSRKDWNLYTGPFEVSPGDTVSVVAHRIGFKPSEMVQYIAE